MTGGLLQLVAKGPADLYLSSNPQITTFKIVYRRHVNFSQYDLELTAKSRGDFSSLMSFPLERGGDLLAELALLVDLPDIVLGKKRINICIY